MASIKGDDGFSYIPIPPPGTFGALGDSAGGFGVVGLSSGPAGVYGASNELLGSGVLGVGINTGGTGVTGNGRQAGVTGTSELSGVFGEATSSLGRGVLGACYVDGGTGVVGVSASATGIIGVTNSTTGGIGIIGSASAGTAIEAQSQTGLGLFAHSGAVAAMTSNDSVAGGNTALLSTTLWAGLFQGNVLVTGNLLKGGGGFLIDHPADPANQYLQHSFVESPERKNFYDGIAVLGQDGEAQVQLPKWFTVLNCEFRYQLTCLGKHAPVFIAQEIEGNSFRIAGGHSGLKVSWLVTGIRQDPWAKANPISAEQAKPEVERGSYLEPELYGQPQEKSLRKAYHQDPEPSPEDALKRAREGHSARQEKTPT